MVKRKGTFSNSGAITKEEKSETARKAKKKREMMSEKSDRTKTLGGREFRPISKKETSGVTQMEDRAQEPEKDK